MLIMGILYVCMFGSIAWMLFGHRLFDIWSLINVISYNFIYTIVTFVYFTMIIGLNLDFSLQT